MYNRAGCAGICPSPQIYCVPSLLTYEFHLASTVTDNIFTAPDPPRDLKTVTFLDLVVRTYRGYIQVLLLLHPFCHSITAMHVCRASVRLMMSRLLISPRPQPRPPRPRARTGPLWL